MQRNPFECRRLSATHSIVQGWNHSAAAAPSSAFFCMHCCTFEYTPYTFARAKKGFARWLPNLSVWCADFQPAFGVGTESTFCRVCCVQMQSATLVRARREMHTDTLFWKGPLHFYGGIYNAIRSLALSSESFARVFIPVTDLRLGKSSKDGAWHKLYDSP
jgi:hypothetical protein